MNLSTRELEQLLAARLREDIECVEVGNGDGRIGCLTPLEYPGGDNVAVWIRMREGQVEVTDFGEATTELPNSGRVRRALDESAKLLARAQGVEYVDGRVSVLCDGALSDVAERVWDVALASAQVALSLLALRQRLGDSEPDRAFALEVADTLRSRNVTVKREHKVEGKSGHVYTATIFVPTVEAVLEPITGHGNQVSAAYRKLGDVRGANGYKLYSVLDDRDEPPPSDLTNLLLQVSSVMEWTRRDDWIHQLV